MYEEVFGFLQEVFPRVIEDGDGTFRVSGEDPSAKYNGRRALDYYATSSDYDLGVYLPFLDELEDMGYFVEWWDAGTAIVAPI